MLPRLPGVILPGPVSLFPATRSLEMAATSNNHPAYPRTWENVAHLRVFRAAAGDWDKVVGWRSDMIKRGWRLLRVSTEAEEIVAVFGKTKLGPGT